MDIFYFGNKAGELKQEENSVTFTYDPQYKGQPISFSMPSFDKIYTSISRYQLPAFFENLLPQGLYREKVARDNGISKDDEFSLLQLSMSPGVIDIKNPLPKPGIPYDIVNNPVRLSEEIELYDDPYKPHISKHRLSLGGSQLKFPVRIDETGLINLANKGDSWTHLLKVPSKKYPSITENEFLIMRSLSIAGFGVADVNLVNGNDGHYLVVSRIDIDQNGERLPMEDLLSAMGQRTQYQYTHGMDTLVSTLQKFGVDPSSLATQYLISWTLGNTDLHEKNISILIQSDGKKVVSKIYDMLNAKVYDYHYMALPLHEGYGVGCNLDVVKDLYNISGNEYFNDDLKKLNKAIEYINVNCGLVQNENIRKNLLKEFNV
jgi:serine/threonine-protein kinase HipA